MTTSDLSSYIFTNVSTGYREAMASLTVDSILESERKMRDEMGSWAAENLAYAYEVEGQVDGRGFERHTDVATLWNGNQGNMNVEEWAERRVHYLNWQLQNASAPIGFVPGTSNMLSAFWPKWFGFGVGILLLCLLSAACVTPAWEPGDPPLTFSVETDRVGEAILMGCALWAEPVGLECEIVERGATVHAYELDLGHHGAYSKTKPCGFLWTDRNYTMLIDVDALNLLQERPDRIAGIAAHEIGHLLGIWGHLPPGHLMDTVGSTNVVTEGDLAALPWAVP